MLCALIVDQSSGWGIRWQKVRRGCVRSVGGIMDFGKWMDQNAERIAAAFAKSDDPKEIVEALKHINQLWRTYAEQCLGWQEDTNLLTERINDLLGK